MCTVKLWCFCSNIKKFLLLFTVGIVCPWSNLFAQSYLGSQLSHLKISRQYRQISGSCWLVCSSVLSRHCVSPVKLCAPLNYGVFAAIWRNSGYCLLVCIHCPQFVLCVPGPNLSLLLSLGPLWKLRILKICIGNQTICRQTNSITIPKVAVWSTRRLVNSQKC